MNNNSIVVNTGTGGLTGFAGISLLGFDDTLNLNSVTVGATGIDLSNAPGGADQAVSINLTQGTDDADFLNVNGVIKSKGTGGVTLNASAGSSSMTIAAAGDITTTGGAVSISSVNLTSSGDITTGTGNISFGSALNLAGNVAINSTSGNVSTGIVTPGANNLSINSGSGTVTLSNNFIATSGNLSITTTNATASAVSIAAVTTTGSLSLNAGGNISASGAITAASVNAKSTAGDVSFGGNVTTTQIGGFTSEATDATKATKIAGAVDVQNGANALVTGNLVSNSASAALIEVASTGTITITGKVDAATAGNDLGLGAMAGGITIGGAVGSGSVALGRLFIEGESTLLVSGTVNVDTLDVGQIAGFQTSINFADNVTVATGLLLDATASGTVSFAKSITATGSAATIDLGSVNGSITVTGNITGKDDVKIATSGSGSISVAGITTDQTAAPIKLETGSGNITTSGAISTSGAGSNIDIDNITSGNITIGGNVSTSNGGMIYLGTETTGTQATGAGNLTIHGTVSTTGTTNSGDIFIGSGGTGTVTVNKAISTGAASSNAGSVFLFAIGSQVNTLSVSKDATITSANGVILQADGSTNTISLASGANVTAVNGVSNTGNGNLNLASNITTTNGSINLSSLSISLNGASSMKAGGTNSGIDLGVVDGAQNLTSEATGSIITALNGAIGGSTPLNSITVVNSINTSFRNLNSASVTISDTTGTVTFAGNTVISKSLTTTTEGYNLTFSPGTTTVIAGAPVFLNTGNVSFFSQTTSLPGGATITGGSSNDANLAGTIVSGGAFNIGSGISIINISDNTQLILNSTSAASTFASPISLNDANVGTFKLLGVGTLTLSADSISGATSNDSISVTNGTLNVTGKIAAATSINNATISGAGGTIGALNSTIGNVTPGGKLTTGAITLGAATNYNVVITGSTTASSLETGAAISLGSAVLNLTSVASGLKIGNQLTIINNTVAGSGNAISGTFAGLAEGATVSAPDSVGNTVNFRISYKVADGSTGNDAVLTVTSVIPPQSAPAQPMVAGQPALNKFTAVGADAGGGPLVTITFPNGTYTSFFAYASGFTGGVRVALGDVNGDGSPEVITGAGPGGGPQVNVYSVNTLSGVVSLQSSFFAFSAPNFTGGVYVAAGRTDSDFFDDVIVGAGAGGGPRVQVYAGSANGAVTSAPVNDFFAYSTAFTGGVVVTAGNRDGDLGDIEEVITAPASNGGYNIKSFDCNGTGGNPTVVESFFAFNDSTSIGGLRIAVGLFDLNNVADIVVGTTNNGFGVILNNAYSGILTAPFSDFTGALRAGVAEDSNGVDYAGVVAGPGGGPRLTLYSVGASSLTVTDDLFVMNQQFRGGLFMNSTIAENVI